MHIRFSTMAALGLAGALLVACSGSEGNDGSSENTHSDAGSASLDGGSSQAGPDGGLDSALGCCPTNFIFYPCAVPGGGFGFACHNPAMGCVSSSTCGAGCDPQVRGQCTCVETQLCILGAHFDRDLCRCVSDLDASPTGGADAGCVEDVLCIRGDHFDRTLCKCVPDGVGG